MNRVSSDKRYKFKVYKFTRDAVCDTVSGDQLW
jgi:hypothetical protein